MNTQQKLADALRAVLPLVPFDGNHADEAAKGAQLKAAREALAAYDDIQQGEPNGAGFWPRELAQVAIFVRGGCVQDVAASVPFDYEVIDADNIEDDDDEEETAQERWERVTKGWVIP